ncbi:putative UPF0481 protein At3g02645 [Corylus avellana]|uniref:putative UPF0481 protein At3g02645 n=1 Tax=Corylus avellana TaxID=13451 RepID=UPI001E1ED337|nr:putative UPF0481 protein At3g02645 [Corylus avellana]
MSFFNSQPDEDQCRQFVVDISNTFSSDDTDAPICVFKVPNSLSASKPEAYIPQIVGLGILHHSRPQTEAMQTYKLKVAKNIHRGLGSKDFDDLHEGMEELVPSIRACYQMYLNDNETLIAFVMAIDGLFLFKLLCCYGVRKDTLTSSNILRGLVDPADIRLHQDGIIRDTMMLENQIPIFVLKIILFVECSESKTKMPPIVKECLPQLLLGYCKAFSPLKVLEKYPNSAALKHAHLLDLLYHLIMLKEPPAAEPEKEEPEEEASKGKRKRVRRSTGLQALGVIASLAMPQEVRQPIELVKGLLELPWSNLDPSSIKNIAPVEEESLIPTASNLCGVGVKFLSAEHISAIGFDQATTSLKLPIIKLSVNSEVIIRNLVAYEVMSKPESEPLTFTRYIELMNGIIKSAEDVAVLKNHRILESDQSIEDDEVVKIFCGSKPGRSANAADLDKAIADVNNYYNGLWKVKAYKLIKKFGLTLWHIRKLVAAILLLSLLSLQTFCTVYGCPRIFDKSK